MRSLTSVLLQHMSSTGNPASGDTALYALPYGPALRTSGGDVARAYDIATGRVSSALTNATATLANMTGLGVPVDAGGVYIFEFSGTYSSSVTTSFIAAGINGPAAGASGVICNLHLHVDVGMDTWHSGCLNAFGTSNTPAFIGTANVPIPWRMYGSCEIGGSGGTLVPQFARNSGAGTITIQAGAWGWALRIA